MTIVNKKSNPARFNNSRHYKATDRVGFKDGDQCGEITRTGSFYLLRLKENPHNAEWVIFEKGGKQ